MTDSLYLTSAELKDSIMYKAWARMRTHMNKVKPFRVYNTPALFPLDGLRCWVLTKNHRNSGTRFPLNCVSIGDGVDHFNEASSVSSLGLDLGSEQRTPMRQHRMLASNRPRKGNPCR